MSGKPDPEGNAHLEEVLSLEFVVIELLYPMKTHGATNKFKVPVTSHFK
jgi:hypothetical protein